MQVATRAKSIADSNWLQNHLKFKFCAKCFIFAACRWRESPKSNTRRYLHKNHCSVFARGSYAHCCAFHVSNAPKENKNMLMDRKFVLKRGEKFSKQQIPTFLSVSKTQKFGMKSSV